ncbi:MAG: hypothetical protein KGO02_10650 [Alphaproteobacteria bacterium]|nr:hypothetical protein [Alphaproteobacteria bacterium]
MRLLLIVVGLFALAIGLLWIGQGTGYVMWPSTSFMLRQTVWAWYGGALTIGALIILTYAARRR